jgi:arylsulfatase A-like enzyme
VERLWPLLGETAPLRLEDETRPTLRLRPGESRSSRGTQERGSRLMFAVGLPEEAPDFGYLSFQVLASGREVFKSRFPLARSNHWWRRSAALDLEGPTVLEFRSELQLGPEAEAGAPGAELAPWVLLASPRVYPPKQAGPDKTLIWISQDTLRADHLSAYGYNRPTSPELTRLAHEWTLFTNGVASASWTLPSLAAQMTSRHPSFHGAVLHAFGTHPRDTTVFEALSAHGFTVLGITGNAFVSGSYGLTRGFDSLRYTSGRADEVAELAERALDEWGGGDLALFVHFMDPHDPFTPPESFENRFARPYAGLLDGKNFDAFDPQTATPQDRAHVVGLYDAEIAYTDQQIGALLAKLSARGLLAGAVIGYTADHGEELLDHGSWHHGGTLYEEVLHVPFAVRVPGAAPRRVTQPVSLLDFGPTILSALGVDRPASFQGRSLLPLVHGGSVPAEPIYSETELTADRSHVVSVREGNFKYVLHVPRDHKAELRVLKEELFDLASDPGERSSRPPSDEAERLRRLALAYLSGARREAAQSSPVTLDAVTMERLRALGYVR